MHEFHIHIDAQALSAEFENVLTDRMGFWRNDFSGRPEGAQAFTPTHHLTRKFRVAKEFRAAFAQVVRHASGPDAMRGYIEGEFVPEDVAVPERPFDSGVSFPFRVRVAPLPAGAFRETEFHLSLDRDRSDPRLLQALLGAGMFATYLPKAYGTAIIFTAQGAEAVIAPLMRSLMDYLGQAGGAVHGSLKEERVARWWVSHPEVGLPPVVAAVDWTPDAKPASSLAVAGAWPPQLLTQPLDPSERRR